MFSYQTWRSTKRHVTEPWGFTLVEIAVVLVIVGLILGTLAPAMMAIIKKDKLKAGRQVVQLARDEVVGYAMINGGRLPALSNIAHRTDPWGSQLFLINAPSLAGTDVCSVNATGMSLIIYSPTGGGGSCTTGSTVQDIASVLGSKGPDYNRQISALTSGQVGILDYGCTGDLYPADNGPASANRPFDDIYEYISLGELKARLCQPASNSTAGGP